MVKYAAQVRSRRNGSILTLPVTSERAALFDTPGEAIAHITAPPAEHPDITAEIWAEYIGQGDVEVWSRVKRPHTRWLPEWERHEMSREEIVRLAREVAGLTPDDLGEESA